MPDNEDYEFVVTVYNYSYKKWKFVIHRPFECEDESWAPPRCWVDQITGQGSLYFKGERTPCTYEECKDLEILAVWDGEQVIDRLMGEHKWEQVMKKPVPLD